MGELIREIYNGRVDKRYVMGELIREMCNGRVVERDGDEKR